MKRDNFDKIILLYLLGQIYTKITKNVNFDQRNRLLRNEFFLGLGNPVRESGTPPYLRSLKMLPIDFCNLYNKLFRSFRLLVKIYGHFKVFSKKIQQPLSQFRFFAVPV